jgi:hypothetical protein
VVMTWLNVIRPRKAPDNGVHPREFFWNSWMRPRRDEAAPGRSGSPVRPSPSPVPPISAGTRR